MQIRNSEPLKSRTFQLLNGSLVEQGIKKNEKNEITLFKYDRIVYLFTQKYTLEHE